MSDPIGLADILGGRVGALRAATEALMVELSSLHGGGSGAKDEDPASLSVATTTLKNRLDRVQTNLNVLRKFSPEFEDKTKNIDAVSQTQRNLMLEYYWKTQIHEMAGKGANVWLAQMTEWFPRMEYVAAPGASLQPGGGHTEKVKAVMTVNERFVPKPTKRARMLVFDEQGDVQPVDLNEMMDYIMRRNKSIKFWKHTETTRGGRRVIKSISCEVNKEMMVYMSFCPAIPEGGPNGESGVAASPMTPSTPNSPAYHRSRATRAAKLKAKKIVAKKPRRDDMMTKAKMAAEEATKIEQEELRKLIIDAKETGKEQELAKAAGLQVTKYIDRVSILPPNEDAPLGAWSSSKHGVFEQITLHARKALHYFRVHHPETSFYHFFSWLANYEKLYNTPCMACKKILAKNASDSAFVPPTFRDYATGLPYHTSCI
ncbi:hypothetical protein SPRG_01382 [Saprolegnia parasitica CBS 223.65]|uniref:Mediator complex subunit 27 n=1 Tax=Saprolegnia parasitica (strain CBS 223.65) TaxID=695850 RepID=A0A067D5Z2_SAPPC|nr:hypothetical protein SPRG_01382 [Saprolegnia parasitica CBS 223.65]KDO34111.1 hypothetical protein SPRG_01382 [Saprolegnia parasitica CBS 223.65]|eukprot:XP_012194990.1 hypothetical protein SPRG_01382 [Saprolegnia parasitica CBS 223.65]